MSETNVHNNNHTMHALVGIIKSSILYNNHRHRYLKVFIVLSSCHVTVLTDTRSYAVATKFMYIKGFVCFQYGYLKTRYTLRMIMSEGEAGVSMSYTRHPK